MVFVKHNSQKSDIFLIPYLVYVFQDSCFSGPRFFRVQVFQSPGFSGSRFFRVQVFQGLSFSGSRFFGSRFFRFRSRVRVQVLELARTPGALLTLKTLLEPITEDQAPRSELFSFKMLNIRLHSVLLKVSYIALRVIHFLTLNNFLGSCNKQGKEIDVKTCFSYEIVVVYHGLFSVLVKVSAIIEKFASTFG